MADEKTPKPSADPKASASGPPPFQAQVVGQYIKDLSFENPNVGNLIDGPGENPNMKIEINVNAQRMGEDLYESAIQVRANATNASGQIYMLEAVYAGLFRVKNLPQEALEPFLLINCPTLTFPFLRRLVADTTREGGYPPLMLDPIDFGALYVQRQKHLAAEAANQTKN